MKIALISPYDFAHPSGVVNHISALANNMAKMGHEIRIIAPVSKPVSTFGDGFIPIGRPWPIPSSGSVARITLSPWLPRQVRGIFDRENFDIVHLHEPLCPMLCTTVLRLSRTVNVGTFHAVGSRGYSLLKPLTAVFLKKWFTKLDGKIAVSKPAKEFASKHFHGDYTLIPNGVDLEHFSPHVSPIDEFSDSKTNILFVGRLEKRKGLDYLLDAYVRVKEEVPNSRLIIVDPGTRWSKKYEKQCNMKDVHFIGRVSYDDLPRYYKTADLVCSPATGRESFGIILLEAMAMGKPIVASNIEGYASVVIHGGQGLLVPPRDEASLAKGIISLVRDETLRHEMGARGREKVLGYGWKHVTQRVLDYYIRVLNEHVH
jgi:phosphatidylinositol alpha-mannosyltransferase